MRSGLLAFVFSLLASIVGGGIDDLLVAEVEMVASSGVKVVSSEEPWSLNHSLGATFEVAARLPFSTFDRKSLS